jgi:hypothetical protein
MNTFPIFPIMCHARHLNIAGTFSVVAAFTAIKSVGGGLFLYF